MIPQSKYPDVPWIPPEFFENQKKVTPDMLVPYMGQHIAWNWEGNTILASAPTEEELFAKLKAQGSDTNRVVLSYVPDW
jgi:hypothetical protein